MKTLIVDIFAMMSLVLCGVYINQQNESQSQAKLTAAASEARELTTNSWMLVSADTHHGIYTVARTDTYEKQDLFTVLNTKVYKQLSRMQRGTIVKFQFDPTDYQKHLPFKANFLQIQ